MTTQEHGKSPSNLEGALSFSPFFLVYYHLHYTLYIIHYTLYIIHYSP